MILNKNSITMAMFRLCIAVVFAVCISALPYKGRSDGVSDTIERILSYGYPAEAHNVVTSDGYILEVHRIPHGKGQKPSGSRPVVFLMHGILGASHNFIHLGPEGAIAFNLADAGYDVWIGNARGNHESRRHLTLNPDDSKDKLKFFDFTWEEIATIDLPAMIDYALEKSGQEKLHYIGHSQGGTVFLVLCSLKPEYNEKFSQVHLLAGVGYMRNFPTALISTVATLTDTIYSTALRSGAIELFPPGTSETSGIDLETFSQYCFGNPIFAALCNSFGATDLLEGITSGADGMGAGGASLKQLAHYGQNLRDKEFRRWNYGLLQNRRVYGSMTPPRYNLGLITADVTMHYTVNDRLLGERDVLNMARDMPKAKVRKVERETFLHVDFVAAEDAKELVTEYIITAFSQSK